MRTRTVVWTRGLICAALSATASLPLLAGDRCDYCEPAKPKKLFKGPPAAPEAGIAFAVPAVVTRGQAVRVPESAVRDALKKAASDSAKLESAATTKSCEERLDVLEQDVRELKSLMQQLTAAVTELARQQQPATK